MEELRIAKKALAEYEVRITALFDEFDRLQKIIDSLKKEKTEHINKNNGMFRECKMMENKNNALKYQIENLQMDLADKINLENKYEEMLAKHTIQCALVESQQKRINEKEMEIGILKNMIPSSYRV
jgi:chromosome segregation ATPase